MFAILCPALWTITLNSCARVSSIGRATKYTRTKELVLKSGMFESYILHVSSIHTSPCRRMERSWSSKDEACAFIGPQRAMRCNPSCIDARVTHRHAYNIDQKKECTEARAEGTCVGSELSRLAHSPDISSYTSSKEYSRGM